MAINKNEQLEKFTARHAELVTLLRSVPAGVQYWSIQKTHSFKKTLKESDKFVKLKPTDDLNQFIRLDNHVSKLKTMYYGK